MIESGDQQASDELIPLVYDELRKLAAIRHIISDLEEAGYVERVRIGRRNSYRIDESLHLRHPIEQHKTIADLIRAIHD